MKRSTAHLAIRLVLAYSVFAGIAGLVGAMTGVAVPKFLLGFVPGLLAGWRQTTTQRQRWTAACILALVSATMVFALLWWTDPWLPKLAASRLAILLGLQAIGALFIGGLALLGMGLSSRSDPAPDTPETIEFQRLSEMKCEKAGKEE